VPVVPAPGLKWDISALTNTGTLGVVTAPQPQILHLAQSGAGMVISGAKGVAGESYCVLASTNLSVGSWVAILTNSFDTNGNFVFTNAVDIGVPQTFYQLKLQ